MHGLAVHRVHVSPFEAFADLRGHSNRAQIMGSNEADDPVDLSEFPDPSKRRCCRLSRKALAPSGAMKDPAEVDAGPLSLRMVQTDTADYVSRRLFDDCPLTVAAQLPLAKHGVGVLQRPVETARLFA